MAKPSKKQIERASQLEQAKKVLSQLRSEQKALQKKTESRSDLSNHLLGFYQEIDKLAKGRVLIEVTPLVVEQVNDIIRDAKKIVENDVYLDRINEFVPAGNNPVYPDVLVVARAVRQSLERSKVVFEGQTLNINGMLTRANTVIGALECFLSREENGDLGLKDDVDRYVAGQVDESCFYENEEIGECFDFDELDSQTVEKYIREIEDNDGDEDETVGAADLEEEQEDEEQEEAEEAEEAEE